MILLMFQGFLILLTAFVICLPIGDWLARGLRDRLRRPRPETERLLGMITSAAPSEAPAPEPAPALTYPVSAFGHTTISRPLQTDEQASL
ncbi:hypothetical protein [Asticcacaulis taihuensis]|uniref:Uncharacterized protein n=1 Tax=Asticcacaulis taihuensis TaxID=260084 RepID=A0A1G4SVS5_9CAUL|nr:hypothetical protein [Asticcacaulis taihuensis]SCW73047.1 hypothetical protein SAMN02927928_3017 [Asticcacaulis taihuensis]